MGITRGQRGYRNEFGYAESTDGIHWRKCRLNPVLTQGRPGTWDGGWIYAAGVVKLDDEESDTHVYAGKPGASYHLFYTGQPSNNELSCGVKRVGYAVSLDGIHWLKWDDPTTTEPPFQDSDPVLTWQEYGRPGFLGVGAGTALRVGDEVRLYYSIYDDRPDTPRPDGVVGTAYATVAVEALRGIVAAAKAKGLLPCATREEIEATLDEPLPLSLWDDLQGRVLAAVQASQSGNRAGLHSALAGIAATRARFTQALERYYAGAFAPLKDVVDQLAAGRRLTEEEVWRLPPERAGRTALQTEFTDLTITAANGPIMIELTATCDRLDVARVAWATDKGYQPGQETELLVGYPAPADPTYRVTAAAHGLPIRALRLQFPAGATVDLREVCVRRIRMAPAP